MSKTYDQLVEAVQSYAKEATTQPGSLPFTSQIQTFVNNGELRIYRELDFLVTRNINSSLAFTPGTQDLDLSAMTQSGTFPVYPIVVQKLSAVVGTATRIPFELVSLDFIQTYWPDPTVTGTPAVGQAKYAMITDSTVRVAPTPDSAYPVQVVGTWRPALMSATNQTTWLGNNLPDLLLAATMVEASAWQRAFGQMADSPQMAMSWEKHYQDLRASAMEEEQRRKGQGPGWTPFGPTPTAGSQRA